MNIYYYGNDGNIRNLGDDELIHYNHNHDALGRFAKSSGARSYEKAIKKHTSNYAKFYAGRMRSHYKTKKDFDKMNEYNEKLRKKHADPKEKSGKYKKGVSYAVTDKEHKKLEKLAQKVRDGNLSTESYKFAQQHEQKQISILVASAKKDGYDVSSRKAIRSAQRGRDFANALASSYVGGYPAVLAKNKRQYTKYGQYYDGETPSRINVDYYKVKNKRKK
jgi:hypothetical protein